MADFAGGAESFTQTDAGQTTAAPAAPSTSQVSSASPSAAPVFTQTPANAPVIRNDAGQFQSPAAPQQFQGQSPGVLAALKASGYDVSGFQDDKSFLSAIDARLTEAETYKKQVEDYQRQLAARGQPIPGSFERINEHLSQPVETKNGWNPPAYDVRNDQFFRFDDQAKRWVPNQPNVPYELVQAKNDYMDYRANFAKEWSENPVDTLWSRTEDRNRALIREEMTNLFKQMQVTKETNDWLQSNASVLFVDGQVDHTGDPAKLTEAGQLAMQAADELDKAGVSDPAARRSLTEKYIAAELSKKYMQAQQDPATRRYTIEEFQQAYRAANGLPPEQAPQQQAVPPQFQPQAPAPQTAYMPQQVQPMPQGWPQQQPPAQFAPPPGAPQAQFQPPMMPPQTVPMAQQPMYPPQMMPPGYPPAQPQMTPEQINEAGKRRFVGGVGHSSSAGPSGGSTGEFVPQSTPGARPNFLNIANQIAQAKGIQL